jgi:hypothetical protein
MLWDFLTCMKMRALTKYSIDYTVAAADALVHSDTKGKDLKGCMLSSSCNTDPHDSGCPRQERGAPGGFWRRRKVAAKHTCGAG